MYVDASGNCGDSARVSASKLASVVPFVPAVVEPAALTGRAILFGKPKLRSPIDRLIGRDIPFRAKRARDFVRHDDMRLLLKPTVAPWVISLNFCPESKSLFRCVRHGKGIYSQRCSRKSRANYAETKDCVTKPGVIPYRIEFIEENGRRTGRVTKEGAAKENSADKVAGQPLWGFTRRVGVAFIEEG